MTGHQVNSFMTDLVQMAKEAEKVPQLEAEKDAMAAIIDQLTHALADREADLTQSRSYAATLEANVFVLEASRDDAELRFLEADERTEKALAFVRGVFGNAGQVIQSLEPPKQPTIPEIEKILNSESDQKVTINPDGSVTTFIEPACQTDFSVEYDIPHGLPATVSEVPTSPVGEPQSSQTIGDTTTSAVTSDSGNISIEDIGTPSLHSNPGVSVPSDPSASTSWAGPPVGSADDTATASPGESVVDPTSSAASEAPTSTTGGTDTSGSAASTEPTASLRLPYAHKLYHEWPGYVSRIDWLAGGGSDYTYDWRPYNYLSDEGMVFSS